VKSTPEYQAWLAMQKFTDDVPLTDAEWDALSTLTLIDRQRLVFEPGNVRWATTDAERAQNRRFYQAIGPRIH
jgi:hypothetical protein